MSFYEACGPWVPTLLDIEQYKVSPPDQSTDWTKYGWSALYVDPDRFPMVSSRMEELTVRFNERFANRMLNAETMPRWQVRLQNRFDTVVARYERAYRVYERYSDEIDEGAMPGEKIVTDQTVRNSGSDKSTAGGSDGRTGKTKVSNTPDSAINDSDDFAGSISKDESTSTYGRTDTAVYGKQTDNDSTVRRTLTGAVLLRELNESVMDWMDIDTQLVAEFEDCFLNIFWYRG